MAGDKTGPLACQVFHIHSSAMEIESEQPALQQPGPHRALINQGAAMRMATAQPVAAATGVA